MKTSNKKPVLDRHGLDAKDRKLLGAYTEIKYEFVHHAAAEKRSYKLFEKGFLDRRSEVVRMRPAQDGNGFIVTKRWAYCRTPAGTEVVKGMK